MTSTYLLLEDIVTEIKKNFKGLVFETKTDSIEPNIWIGHVPPKRSMPTGTDNEYQAVAGDPPFVVVRYLDDEDKDKDKARVLESRIGILSCIYSKDSYNDIKSGYYDILNMADRVLLALLSKRFWGDNHWWLGDEPIKRTCGLQKELSSIYEAGAHEHPLYGMAVVATFNSSAIARNIIQ